MTKSESPSEHETSQAHLANQWAVFLLVVAAVALLAGLALAYLPEPFRYFAFWLVMAIAALAIVGAVGWAYTETRNWERMSQRPRSARQRIVSYIAAGVVVAALAVGATLVPSPLARILWIVYIPLWLVGGWWFRRRSQRMSRGRHVRP